MLPVRSVLHQGPKPVVLEVHEARNERGDMIRGSDKVKGEAECILIAMHVPVVVNTFPVKVHGHVQAQPVDAWLVEAHREWILEGDVSLLSIPAGKDKRK